MGTQRRIADANDAREDTTHLITLRDLESDDEREAILLRADGEVHAWLNYCQHYTRVNIDKGDGAEMRDGELICENHGAYFESETGRCTFGPCEGAYLNRVAVTVEDGGIYLTDDEYEFVREGAIETDETDLESKSNYKF
jgi:nitrite reductase/ring-hydroxylating ferredoxin subunit